MSEWWSGFACSFACFVLIPAVTIVALRMSGILELTVILMLERGDKDEKEKHVGPN